MPHQLSILSKRLDSYKSPSFIFFFDHDEILCLSYSPTTITGFRLPYFETASNLTTVITTTLNALLT